MIKSNIAPNTNGIRKDWLEKVGITKNPETIAEYEAAFDKFVSNDPDGNGKKDTYALSATGMNAMINAFQRFFMANGVSTFMLMPDGSINQGATATGSKETLKTLASWYKKGFIDPEFITTDDKILEQKWNNGKIGFVETRFSQLAATGPMFKGVTTLNKDAKVEMLDAPKGVNGKFGYNHGGKITSSLAFGAQLEKDKPKLERALQVVDKILSDKGLWLKVSKGEEGVHYKVNEKNYTIALEPYETAQKQGSTGKLFFNSWSPIPKIQDQVAVTDLGEISKHAAVGNIEDGKDYFGWIYVLMTPDDRKILDKVNTIRNKAYIEMITGAKPIE